MADVTAGTIGIANRTRSRNPIIKEFIPSSVWTEDSSAHYLLVDLPYFKKEEVTLQFDNYLTVNGQRKVNDKEYVHFKSTFKLPENSDIDNITGKFEGEYLYVTVPKLIVEKDEEEPEHDENHIGNASGHVEEENEGKNTSQHFDDNASKDGTKGGDISHENHVDNEDKIKKISSIDGFHKQFSEKWQKESSQLERTTELLNRNKWILLTALISFSLGVYVAR